MFGSLELTKGWADVKTNCTTPGGIGITVVFDGLTDDEGIDVKIKVCGAVAINGEVLAFERVLALLAYVEDLSEAGLNGRYDDNFKGTVLDELLWKWVAFEIIEERLLFCIELFDVQIFFFGFWRGGALTITGTGIDVGCGQTGVNGGVGVSKSWLGND